MNNAAWPSIIATPRTREPQISLDELLADGDGPPTTIAVQQGMRMRLPRPLATS
jgi:hypothetical protein